MTEKKEREAKMMFRYLGHIFLLVNLGLCALVAVVTWLAGAPTVVSWVFVVLGIILLPVAVWNGLAMRRYERAIVNGGG